MISVSFSIFRYTEDWGMHYKTIPSVLISDNHSLVNSFNFSPLGNNSTRLSKKKRETFQASRNQLHHSVTFYFTVLSEPSQDSSTMKKNICVLSFIIYICSININTIFKILQKFTQLIGTVCGTMRPVNAHVSLSTQSPAGFHFENESPHGYPQFHC